MAEDSPCDVYAASLYQNLTNSNSNGVVRVENVSGLTVDIALTREYVDKTLVPGVKLASELYSSSKSATSRCIIGVCGPPGIGKSVYVQLFEKCWKTRNPEIEIASLGMDAYHFPNSVLREKGLLDKKGLPETIDVHSLDRDLKRLSTTQENDVKLPIYDRKKHEPVKDSVTVSQNVKIVLVEGIHLFNTTAEWENIRYFFDGWILFTADSSSLSRQRVVQRKVGNGVAMEQAEAHFDRVDQVNFESIQRDLDKYALSDPKRPPNILNIHWYQNGGLQGYSHSSFHAPGSCEDFKLSSSSPTFCFIGASPALQKSLSFDSWRRDQVNRSKSILTSIGGKGQQCVKAASLYLRLHDVTIPACYIYQWLGGSNGKKVGELLHQNSANIIQRTVEVMSETRTCYTLLDDFDRTTTELIEPSDVISSREYDTLLDHIAQDLQSKNMRFLCVSGTCPPVAGDKNLYFDVARLVKDTNIPFVLDAYKDISPDVLSSVSVLKINSTELMVLSKYVSLALTTSAQVFCDIPTAAFFMLSRFPRMQYIVITAGSERARLFPQGKSYYYEFLLPELNNVQNPIGAGDVTTAVTMIEYYNNTDEGNREENMVCALTKGLAAASASCLHVEGAVFTKQAFGELCQQVRVAKVTCL